MNSRTRRTFIVAMLMLLPNFIGFLVFTAGPVAFSLVMAFTNWDLTLHNKFSTEKVMFVGLDNFKTLLGGGEWSHFSQYLGNTIYLMAAIPVGIALALIAAILLNSDIKPLSGRSGKKEKIIIPIVVVIGALSMAMLGVHPGGIFLFVVTGILVLLAQIWKQTTFRTLFYLPNLTSGVAIFILWKAMYRPETGPINGVLRPILGVLESMVRATPASLWIVGAWVLIIASALLFLWSSAILIIKFKDKDVGAFGMIFGIIGLGVFFTLIGSNGLWIMGLPHRIATVGGLEVPTWLISIKWSKPSLLIMSVFFAMGSNNMLLYLAAISNVPKNLYDAAAIDGANRWQTFWNVTWPQLAPTTFFIVIMATISGLQGGFDQARVMTSGGPAGSTTTLSYYLYNIGFSEFKLGLASAIAWTMFVLIFSMTLINWQYGNRMVND